MKKVKVNLCFQQTKSHNYFMKQSSIIKKILEKTKKNYYCMLFLYLTLNMRFAPLMECHLYSIVSNISYIQARRKK